MIHTIHTVTIVHGTDVVDTLSVLRTGGRNERYDLYRVHIVSREYLYYARAPCRDP